MEHWFIFFWSSLNSLCFPFFHASSSLSLSLISSHNSLHTWGTLFFDGVSEGPGYSSKGIKCVQQRNWLCVFSLSEPCSDWPVPDDQEPRRCPQHPWCTGDRVQKWFVIAACVTCWFCNQSSFVFEKVLYLAKLSKWVIITHFIKWKVIKIRFWICTWITWICTFIWEVLRPGFWNFSPIKNGWKGKFCYYAHLLDNKFQLVCMILILSCKLDMIVYWILSVFISSELL